MRECDCGGIFGAKANPAKNPSGSYDTYSSEPIQGCSGYAPSNEAPSKPTQGWSGGIGSIPYDAFEKDRAAQDKQRAVAAAYEADIASAARLDIRANVEGFLLYIQGYQDALVVFSSMLEEVIGE